MTPQIIMLVFVALNLIISGHQHGKPKEGKHNLWIGLIGLSIQMWILYSGGFWDPILPK